MNVSMFEELNVLFVPMGIVRYFDNDNGVLTQEFVDS